MAEIHSFRQDIANLKLENEVLERRLSNLESAASAAAAAAAAATAASGGRNSISFVRGIQEKNLESTKTLLK